MSLKNQGQEKIRRQGPDHFANENSSRFHDFLVTLTKLNNSLFQIDKINHSDL